MEYLTMQGRLSLPRLMKGGSFFSSREGQGGSVKKRSNCSEEGTCSKVWRVRVTIFSGQISLILFSCWKRHESQGEGKKKCALHSRDVKPLLSIGLRKGGGKDSKVQLVFGRSRKGEKILFQLGGSTQSSSPREREGGRNIGTPSDV